jgi:TetR/AcrR family transcriptional regulator
MPVQKHRPARRERTRREILVAAERCFAERGFERTRLEDIGALAGLGAPALLYHFPGKRELYHAVLDDLFGDLLRQVGGVLADGGDLPGRIEAVVRLLVAFVGRRPAAARITLREASADDPSVRAEVRARAAPFLALLTRVFEEGERSGALRPIRSDPFHFVSALAGTILFYVAALPSFVPSLPYDHLAPGPLAELERDALAITRRLLGLRARRKEPR